MLLIDYRVLDLWKTLSGKQEIPQAKLKYTMEEIIPQEIQSQLLRGTSKDIGIEPKQSLIKKMDLSQRSLPTTYASFLPLYDSNTSLYLRINKASRYPIEFMHPEADTVELIANFGNVCYRFKTDLSTELKSVERQTPSTIDSNLQFSLFRLSYTHIFEALFNIVHADHLENTDALYNYMLIEYLNTQEVPQEVIFREETASLKYIISVNGLIREFPQFSFTTFCDRKEGNVFGPLKTKKILISGREYGRCSEVLQYNLEGSLIARGPPSREEEIMFSNLLTDAKEELLPNETLGSYFRKKIGLLEEIYTIQVKQR